MTLFPNGEPISPPHSRIFVGSFLTIAWIHLNFCKLLKKNSIDHCLQQKDKKYIYFINENLRKNGYYAHIQSKMSNIQTDYLMVGSFVIWGAGREIGIDKIFNQEAPLLTFTKSKLILLLSFPRFSSLLPFPFCSGYLHVRKHYFTTI